MKKHSLLKAIGITFLCYVVLTWIIKTGSYSSGTFTEGTTSPLGLADLFLYPTATVGYSMFVVSALVVLAVGGLYGVLRKTGALTSMVDSIIKRFKGKERLFLSLTTVFYALASAGLNLSLPLFLIIPLSISVIVTMGFDKIKAFLATFGAILVGGMTSFVGSNMDGYNYVNYFLKVEIKNTIIYSLVLFVLVLAVLLFFVLKGTKTVAKKGRKKAKEVEEETVIPLYDAKVKACKKPLAAKIVFIILVLIAFLSMFNWNALNINFFNDIYTKIMEFTVGKNDYPIFANILGSLNPFGIWGNYELIMIIVIATMLISWIYKLKAKDAIDAFVEGAKEMLPVAFIVIVANILLFVLNNSEASIYPTILNKFVEMSSKFNYFAVAGFTAVGSFMFSSFPYLLYAVYDPITTLFANDVNIISITIQAVYGLFSLIVPTSVMLVLGLKYMNISYKEWLKNAWKLLVSLFVIITIAILIFAAII